jgi:hypothetical protein
VSEDSGTADALRLVAPHLTAPSVIVYSGDCVTDLHLPAVMLQHQVCVGVCGEAGGGGWVTLGGGREVGALSCLDLRFSGVIVGGLQLGVLEVGRCRGSQSFGLAAPLRHCVQRQLCHGPVPARSHAAAPGDRAHMHVCGGDGVSCD